MPTLRQYNKMKIPKKRWIIEPLLETQGTAILGGDAKLGKSMIIIFLCYALRKGLSFFGFKTRKITSIICFQRENSKYQMAERVQKMAAGLKLSKVPSRVYFPTDQELPVPDLATTGAPIEDFIRAIQDPKWNEPELIIFDPISDFQEGDELTKNVNTVTKNLNRIREETGAAIVLVHHPTKEKADGLKGSIKWRTWPSTVMAFVEKGRKGNKQKWLQIKYTRGEQPKRDRIPLNFDKATCLFSESSQSSEDNPNIQKVINIMKRKWKQGCPKRSLLEEELGKRNGLSPRPCWTIVQKCLDTGLLKAVAVGNRKEIHLA